MVDRVARQEATKLVMKCMLASKRDRSGPPCRHRQFSRPAGSGNLAAQAGSGNLAAQAGSGNLAIPAGDRNFVALATKCWATSRYTDSKTRPETLSRR
ncbi:hypothetical protein SDC9_205281 [bioreactor metagenome]|uniref:Uncharacterized protein n=1 Tax=bioreactor metagenome TaxID=1076179 RepID=A0A645J2F9_9ZZZZ